MKALRSVLLGPVPCQECAQAVVWTGKRWRNVGQRGMGVHKCPGPRCGVWMSISQDRCARMRGHANHHRSRYALDNARVARTGHAA